MKKKPGTCVQCGKCLDVCPLFKATGREELTPRSKFFLESLEGGEGLSEKDFKALASLCLACGRCAKNCPQNLSGVDLVSGLRAESGRFLRSCWNLWLQSPGILWPAASALSKFSSEKLPEPFGSARKKMEALFAEAPAPWAGIVPEKIFENKPAMLFEGCVARYARKDWTQKAEKFMTGLGLEIVKSSGFNCCGSSMGSAGLFDARNRSRMDNIQAWIAAGKPLLVTICATCLKGLGDYEREDFDSDEDYAEWLAALTPLSSFLIDGRIEITGKAPDRIAYHHPCHAPDDDKDKRLVERICGSRLAPVKNDLCCGFGGVMQLGAPELSLEVGRHCINELTGSLEGSVQILTGCSACVVQLATLTDNNIFAGHWLDILE